MTAAQQHLITAALLRPTVSHVVAMYVDIVGHIDVPALQRAVGATAREMVVRRLQVGFADDLLVQWIAEDDNNTSPSAPAVDVELPVVDLRGVSNPVTAGIAWMERATAEPADPLVDPAGSDTLLRVGDHRWFWYSRFQAHTFDSAGMRTLLERAAELYRSDSASRAPQPPAVARTLFESDRRYRQSDRYEVDRRYWLEVLADNPEPTSISVLREHADARPLAVEAALGGETRARVDVLARDSGSTAAGILTAATAAFLAMRTGRERVVLTLPVTGRTAVAARRAPGTVANVLPVAIDVTPSTRVSDLIGIVRSRITEALRHQQFRLEDISSPTALPTARDSSPGPSINLMLFPSTVSFGDTSGTIRVLSEGPVEDLAIDAWTTSAGDITIGFRANPARYDRPVLDGLHTAFVEFLGRFVAAELGVVIGAIPGVDTADWLAGIRSQRAVPFWTQQYLSTAPELDLPIDALQGPPTPFEVSAETTVGLDRRASEFETGTAVLVMAALLGVLRRFGITGPVPVGIPVDGFVHGAATGSGDAQVVVFRPNTPRDTSLADLVIACDRQVRNAFEYAGTRPTGAAVAGRIAFRVLLTADRPTAAHPDFADLSVGSTSATADLTVTVGASPDRSGPLSGSGTVSWIGGARPAAALATALPAMLRAIVEEPTTLISQVPVLDPDQRAILTVAPSAPRPVASLIDLYHRVVGATPDAPAISAPDEELTYGALFRRSNRLARFLIRQGVGPESVVVVLLPSGARRIVTAVAACEAGGAYLPLEPGAGRSDVVELINRVRPVCIVTTRRWARHLEEVPFHIIDLDDWEVTRRIEVLSEEPIAPTERYGAIRADNTAVVLPGPRIAGRRMATPMSHGAVVRLLAASAERCEFRPSDVWTVIRPPAMIPTAWDMWGALVHGSRLAVPATSIAEDPGGILKFLTRQHSTIVCVTPGILERFAGTEPESLRLVVVSGDAADTRTVAGADSGYAPDAEARLRILHRAGPLELARHAFRRESGTGTGAGFCPVPGTRAYILDERLEPVPLGAPGRLYVAGDRLPRNYLRDASATAVRLVANPFAEDAEAGSGSLRADNRMLRTETRARWVAPDLLEILPTEDRGRARITSLLRPGSDLAHIGGSGVAAEEGGIEVDPVDGSGFETPGTFGGTAGGVSDRPYGGAGGDTGIAEPSASTEESPAGSGQAGAPDPTTFSEALRRTEMAITGALSGLPGLTVTDRDVDLVAAAPDAFTVVIAAQRIASTVGCRVRPTDVLEYPRIAWLADHLVRTYGVNPQAVEVDSVDEEFVEAPGGDSVPEVSADLGIDPSDREEDASEAFSADSEDDDNHSLSTDLALAALAESAAIDSEQDATDSGESAPSVIYLRGGDDVTTPLVIVGPDAAADFDRLGRFLSGDAPVVTASGEIPDDSEAVGLVVDEAGVTGPGEAVPGETALISRYVRQLERSFPTGAFRLIGRGAAGPLAFGIAAALGQVQRDVVDVVLIDSEPMGSVDTPANGGVDSLAIDGPLTYVTILDGTQFDPTRSAAAWRPLVRGPIIDHRIDVEPNTPDADADGDLPDSAVGGLSSPSAAGASTDTVWRAIADIIGKADPTR